MTKIIYYTTNKENNPVDEFLNSLSERQQRKILRILSNIKTYGLNSAIPHIKKLAGTTLWEIRVLGNDNIRVLYASFLSESVILLHGFIKKTQQTPKREIETASNRLSEWLNRKIKS